MDNLGGGDNINKHPVAVYLVTAHVRIIFKTEFLLKQSSVYYTSYYCEDYLPAKIVDSRYTCSISKMLETTSKRTTALQECGRVEELTRKLLPAEDKGTNSEFVPGLVPLTGWAAAVREQNAQLVSCVGTAHLTDVHYCSTSDKEHTNLSCAIPSKEETPFKQELVLTPTSYQQRGTFGNNSEFVAGLTPFTEWMKAVQEQNSQLVPGVRITHLTSPHSQNTHLTSPPSQITHHSSPPSHNTSNREGLNLCFVTFGEEETYPTTEEMVLMLTAQQESEGVIKKNSELVTGVQPLTECTAAVQEQNAQLLPGVLATHTTSPHCCNTRDREHINPLLATFGEEETFRFIKEQEIVLPTTAWHETEGAFVERCEFVKGALPFGRLLAIMEKERVELVM